ncbi:dihydroorotate dehydrogenase [Haloimpatiens sp. FM7315]|uniref:dihydroorotate dehydrogenase n=1 Tax=Haloimpatiens sp. FM7315 TaxID=3298609 RepID=UPI00370C065D
MSNVDTSVDICGVEFKNPVIAASGTFGFGQEFNSIYPVKELGGICTKGLTFHKKNGNNGVRIHETRAGMMNSVGLQNPGIDEFINVEFPKMKKLGTNIIANLGGNNLEDYIEGVKKLNKIDVDIVELNISCPNVKEGGMAFGIKSETAYKVVSEVRKCCEKPLLVKLSPNAEDIVDMALKCEKAGADGLSLVNTFKAMAIDIRSAKPVFDNVFAGLSGPCIKPIALRMVYEVCKNVSIPVIGMGGIENYEDAIEFLMAGATAIQVGTSNFSNPYACLDIIKDIEKYMIKNKIGSLKEIKLNA